MTVSNRTWTLGALLLVVVIVAAAWFIGISPVLAQATASSSERETVVMQNSIQEARLASLQERFETIDSLRADLESQQKLVPGGTQLPRFLGQLDQIAVASGVSITEVTVSDAVAYTPPVGEAPTEDVAAEVEAAPAADVGDPGPETGGTAVESSLITGESFVAIPVSINTVGSFEQVMNFVSGLQTGERLFLVTALSVNEASDGSAFTGTATGFIYVLIDAAAASAEEETAEVEAVESVTAASD